MTARIVTQDTRQPINAHFYYGNGHSGDDRTRNVPGQLWEREAERASTRNPGGIVYVYGHSIATVIHPDKDGAIVREHDDNGETWFPWSDLHAQFARNSIFYGLTSVDDE